MTGQRASLRSFTSALYNYETRRSFPWVNCKGSDCMLCLRWLISVAVAVLNTQQLDQGLKEAMEVIVSSARLGVRWFDLVYQHGLWLSPSCGACLYEVGVGFVDGYAKLFAYAWATQQSLYALVPKYHFQLHTLHELHTQLSSGSLVICNPVHWDCSQNEDLIGRLSKLSRVADCRVASARVLELYLIKACILLKRHFGDKSRQGQ